VNKQKLVALGIAALVALWMLIPRPAGNTASPASTGEQTIVAVSEDRASADEAADFVVRAARLTARDYTEYVRVRGRTEAFRRVDVRAEQPGRVVATPVAEGSRVTAGDVLCEVAVDTRDSDLREAQSREQQTRVELEAARDLRQQGLTSAVSVAQANAAHEAARAAVQRAQLALDNTRIRAPFDGVVETRAAEIGNLLERGAVCATVMDDDPMLVVGMVPEQQIGKLEAGAVVNADLLTGEQVTATVTYLARSADALSRSYRVEATVDSQKRLRDGITTEMFIAASQTRAHLIPPSALTLNDNGDVGVKILDAENRVAFMPVTLIGDQTGQMEPGVWVTDLPAQVTLITHGQEIVFPGQQVRADFDWSQSSL